MNKLTLSAINVLTILREHDLLIKTLNFKKTDNYETIAYNSKEDLHSGLFFCKGDNFKKEYLKDAIDNGCIGYVSEKEYSVNESVSGIIVKSVSKAMALLSAAFYNYPQNDLYIIATTGTKGKTTTTYFLHSILDNFSHKKTAMFSTIDRVLGPNKNQRFKSDLTTPESLDLYHDMYKAVSFGMHYLVMEVSSQAYKKNRVFGLKYDLGIFLNISPDHIGENEHPNYEDYLHCKMQLLINSKKCLINAQTNNFKEIYLAACGTHQKQDIYLFSSKDFMDQSAYKIDFTYQNQVDNLSGASFLLNDNRNGSTSRLFDNERYSILLPGNYNEENATAAIIATKLLSVDFDIISESIKKTTIPGRFEFLNTKNHGSIFIDYAHNYIAVKSVLSFLKQQKKYKNSKVIIVVGSTGNKGVSRREGFGKAINEEADVAYLTSDDPGFEDPLDIAKEIDSFINHDKVEVHIELNRQKAIKLAIENSHVGDLVVLAAKGEDPYQKINGVNVPYPTDMVVAKNVISKLEK